MSIIIFLYSDEESKSDCGIENDKALLIERLKNPKTSKINLKEFRDQLLGERSVRLFLFHSDF